ncbi:uncharacterized protein LOC111622431 [Centruroides sculpturatus]|uniref:uncharacterized protein LOC111622431 n=1 Tax=Centruroides sculpturatus TaxID=218467 RepID=UPI000C6EC562|nr:uncharacterized protein LOC111622431 [Centruroides sculpturatus]
MLSNLNREPDKVNIEEFKDSDIRILSWNVQGLRNKFSACYFDKILTKYDIIGLEETWVNKLNTNEEYLLQAFEYLQVPAEKNLGVGRPKGGIMLIMKKSLGEMIYSFSTTYFIFSLIKLESPKFNNQSDNILAIIVSYFPPYQTLQNLYQEMEKVIMDWMHFTSCWIIMGDFNARIGNYNDSYYKGNNQTIYNLRNSHDSGSNPKGNLLLNFVKNYDLYILNGRTKEDYPGRHTFMSSRGASVIDYIMCSEAILDYCEEFKVLDHDLSDHFPVHLIIRDDSIKSKYEKARIKEKEQVAKDRFKLRKFETEIGGRIKLIEKMETNELYDSLIKIFNEYKIEPNHYKNRYSNKIKSKFKQDWFDMECYRAKRRKETKLTTFRRSNKFFWLTVKNYRLRKGYEKQDTIGFDKWIKFFGKRQLTNINFYTDQEQIGLDREERIINIPIQASEMIKTINKLKETTATGPDSIPNCLLKRLPPEAIDLIALSFNYMYENNKYPDSWKYAERIL